MNKILFISANKFKTPYPVYPIGISYLETYFNLNIPEYNTLNFDFIDSSIEEYEQYLRTNKPSFICISLRNIDDVNSTSKESFLEWYKIIIESTRKSSDSLIIIGGSGFSVFPVKMFEYLNPDFGIYGEGEESLSRLIKSIIKNNIDYSIEGLVYKSTDNQIIFNKKTQYVKNLDLCFDSQMLDYYWKSSGMLSVQTKRGCPYDCIYCTYPLIEGKKVRTLSPEKIVDSLKELYFKRNINYIFFTDSVFNINNDFNFELAERIIKSKINIKWGAYFTFKNLDEKLLVILKKSGLSHIEFGTESLSDITLKNYGKLFTFKEIKEKSDLCNRLDIDFAHFLILAGYGETDDTINETFENSKKINNTVFFPFIGMRIYPGTILQKYAVTEGLISESDDLLNPKYYISKNVNIDTLKSRAKLTSKRWIFPDEDLSKTMTKMRDKNKKGLLWEYLLS